nr:MAG TPA: hypothetical protein [Caudoviricetes sp.]
MSNNEIKPSESGGENVQYATANIGGVRATRKQAKEWVRVSLEEVSDGLIEYADRQDIQDMLLEARAVLRYLDDLLIATAALEGMYD